MTSAPKHRRWPTAIGFLVLGAVVGGMIGFEAMSLYLIDKGTEREWWGDDPAIYDKWRFGGTMIGACIGIAIGIAVDFASFRRHKP